MLRKYFCAENLCTWILMQLVAYIQNEVTLLCWCYCSQLNCCVFSSVSVEDIVGREVQRVDGSHRSQNCRSAEDQPATVSRLVNCTSSSALHCQLQIIVNSISLSAATHCQPHLIVSYTFIATLHCQLHVISRTS